MFLSNQATDDHLKTSSIDDIQPFESVIIEGIVKRSPWVISGGHILFSLKDPIQESCIDCAAYEPTKQFREVIKALYPGDHVVVYGGVRQNPLTVNIEKIKIRSLVEIKEKIENPVCNRCGKHMKSIGRDQGYRCKSCGTRSNEPKQRVIKRLIEPGMYEVPVVARRHLSRPLKLINQRIPC
jgi:tRNA(Ile2)-agmatinylcytidine synthase